MGLLETLGFKGKAEVTAQYAPAIMDSTYGAGMYSYNSGLSNYGYGVAVDRNLALQVASVSRCRNLIAGVISSIDLGLYKKSTGKKLESPLWLDQMDIRQPLSVTLAYLVDALLFYGVGYLKVQSIYFDDQRPSGFEFVPNTRVTVTTNKYGDEVEYYSVNGERVPMSGIGSLVTFQSLLPGVLQTGGRTIQAALDIQKAAAVAAATPMATTILKNTGADLPEAQIQGLLAAWKAARNNRSTAYLTSTLEAQNIGFSPKDMTYNESSQYLATEISRLMNCPSFMIMNNSMTYQNILDARKEFVAYSLQPFISAIENRLSMDDLTAHGNVVRFAIDETFLRADTMARLDAIEKMLNLGLIDLGQAQQMEQLTPNGSGDTTNVALNV